MRAEELPGTPVSSEIVLAPTEAVVPAGAVEECHSLGRGRPGGGNGRKSFAEGRSRDGGILYES